MSNGSVLPPLVIYGASSHGRVVADAVERAGEWRIAGWIDDRARGSVLSYPVLGGAGDLARIAGSGITALVVAIGDNSARERATARVREAVSGAHFPAVVHPSAVIARDVEIGPGTVVFAGALVNTGARVGAGVILNTGCRVDHDCRIGDFASIAPGATLGGNVSVGPRSAISLAAGVIHGRTIGEDAVVGAGAVVVDDVPNRVIAFGVPCRVIRSRRPDEPYL